MRILERRYCFGKLYKRTKERNTIAYLKAFWWMFGNWGTAYPNRIKITK